MPSKQHEEAMDYIYQRIEDSDQPGVHVAFEEHQNVQVLDNPQFDEEEETQCQKCKRGVNLYNEPIFVVGIYVNDVKEAQEFWCKQYALKGMKGELS